MPTDSPPRADHPLHATVVFVGHHQSGKSTAAGHLLVKLGGLDRRALERLERETSNRPTSRYAWLLDRLRLERDRAMTLDLKLSQVVLPASTCTSTSGPTRGPSSPGLALTMVDTPGHPSYLRNTIAGITQADIAVLVVDSRPAVMESPASCTQTRDLAQLATTLANQRTLVVAINHLDLVAEADPGLAEQRFKDAAEAIKKLIKRQTQSATFVPVSAYAGDNLTEASPRLTWWKGPTLLEAITTAVRSTTVATAAAAAAAAGLPLRIPLIGVFKVGGIGTVPAGRLAGGNLRKGAAALLLPPELPPQAAAVAPPAAAAEATSSATATSAADAAAAAGVAAGGDGGLSAAVRSIESFHDSRTAAGAGDWVGLAVKGVPTWRLRRGCVVSDAADRPARLAESFTAKVQVLRDPTSKREGRARSLRPGYSALVHVHTAQALCRLMSIQRCNNKGEVVEANAPALREGDIAEVELRPLRPLVVEPFKDYPALGRFVVRAAVRSERLGLAELAGQGAGGGAGGGGGGAGAAMTPVIVALGRVEAVKYAEAPPVARRPSEQSGTSKRAAASEPPSTRSRAKATNTRTEGVAASESAAEASIPTSRRSSAVAAAAADAAAAGESTEAEAEAATPIIDVRSDGEEEPGDGL